MHIDQPVRLLLVLCKVQGVIEVWWKTCKTTITVVNNNVSVERVTLQVRTLSLQILWIISSFIITVDQAGASSPLCSVSVCSPDLWLSLVCLMLVLVTETWARYCRSKIMCFVSPCCTRPSLTSYFFSVCGRWRLFSIDYSFYRKVYTFVVSREIHFSLLIAMATIAIWSSSPFGEIVY